MIRLNVFLPVCVCVCVLIRCNLAKAQRDDSCVFEAACMHMYLGHPTDNVRIESLKKCDAWKQSMSAATAKLFPGLSVTTLSLLCDGTFVSGFTLIGCLITSCYTQDTGR